MSWTKPGDVVGCAICHESPRIEASPTYEVRFICPNDHGGTDWIPPRKTNMGPSFDFDRAQAAWEEMQEDYAHTEHEQPDPP